MAGADDISGGAGDDGLYGGAGDDVLDGGAGGDMLYGEAGKDVLIGGAGGDVFVLSSDQFTDADSALIIEDFSDSAGDKILIDLKNWGIGAVTGFAGANLRVVTGHINALTTRTEDDATTQNTAIYYTQGTDDILVMVLEDFTGLNFADDVLVAYDGNFGTTGADSISGTARADKLYGFAGDDWLAGGAGADTLDGGVGADTLYGGAGADVLYGGAGVDRLFGEAGADTIYGGADIDAIKGGAGADTLYGEGGEDTLYGGTGDDVLYGGDADDTLYGESGADTIYGGAGVDRLYGGVGADRLYGGAGRDRIYGGADDDWLYGDGNRDTLYGDAGADRIYGGADADYLYGNAGADTLDGGAGADALYGNDGADIIYGGADADQIYGGAGNDVLYGDDGDDALYGGDGDDVLYGGKGVNYLTGGAGADVFVIPQEFSGDPNNVFILTDYNTREGDLIVYLQDGVDEPSIFDFNRVNNAVFSENELDSRNLFNSATDDPNTLNVSFEVNGATIIVVEDVSYATWNDYINFIAGDKLTHGTQGADIITGNADDNALIGLAGDDVLHGGGGADIIWGHLGADTLYGGAGDDTIYGDADLNTRDGPHYYSGADTIYGGDGNDFIFTGLGEDTAYGGRGDDAIFGGASEVSVLSGGAGIDFLSSRANNFATFVLDLEVRDGEHYDAVADFKFDNNDRFKSNQIRIYATAEQLRILDAIDDEALWLETLQELLNIRWDEAGDIKFTSTLKEIVKDFGDFQDLPDGFTFRGADTDTDNNDDVVFYRKLGTIDKEDDVAVLFLGNLEINGVTGAKVTRAIFDLQLHPHTPTLSGTNGADTLEGAAGTDSIHGGVGADTILGHGGNDYLFGNEDDDTIYGGAGNDYIDGGTSADTIYGGDGNDEIDGGTESDILYGGAGDDEIAGGTGNDRIYGGAGFDTIDGGVGADYIDGGAGDDVLEGGMHNDRIYGGAGADTLWGDDEGIFSFQSGADILYGGAGDDRLYGVEGSDILRGGDGDDVLDGGGGDDVLHAGTGTDILIGSHDEDFFVISSDLFDDSDSVAIIEDFDISHEDRIRLDLKNWGSKAYGTWADLNLRVAVGHITAPGITRTEDDANTQNTAIYHRQFSDTAPDWLTAGDYTVSHTSSLVIPGFSTSTITYNTATHTWTYLGNSFPAVGAIATPTAETITFTLTPTDTTIDPITETLEVTYGRDADGLYYTFDGVRVDIADDTTSHSGTFKSVYDDTLIILLEDFTGLDFARDTIITFDSNFGTTGDDILVGDARVDALYGHDGADAIYGGGGADVLDGGAGDDRIFGAGDADTIDGGTGADIIYGDAGADTLKGEAGDDLLIGGAGADTLEGGGEDDVLYGGAGVDRLAGNAEDDMLYGGAGNDYLDGGLDDDILFGGGGMDVLYGGLHKDIFVISSDAFTDSDSVLVIEDFAGWNGHGDNILIDLKDWGDKAYGTWADLGLRVDTGHITADVSSTQDHAGTANTAIYHTQFSDTAPDWLIAGDYTASHTSSVTAVTSSTVTYDTATHTWTYLGHLFPAVGSNPIVETITFTLTPDATKYPSATALTETLEATQGNDADGLYYIFDGVRVDIAANTVTHSGKFKTGHEENLIMLIEDYTTLVFSDDHLENDIIIAFDGTYGTAGDDILVGDARDNYIVGREGADILYGGAGKDYLLDFTQDKQEWIYGGAGDDHIRAGNKDMVFGGTGNDILRVGTQGNVYGGDGIDYIDAWNAVRYHLDTRQITGNTDVVADFLHDPGLHDHYLLVYVSAADKALIDAASDKLEKLKQVAKLRFEDGTTPDAIDAVLTAHFAAEGLDRRDDPGAMNRLIYHTRGTGGENDDLLLMVLEDFTATFTYDMFDVRVAPDDFDVNGEAPPAESVIAYAETPPARDGDDQPTKTIKAYDDEAPLPNQIPPSEPEGDAPTPAPTPAEADPAPISTNPTESGERLHVSDDTNSVYGLGGNDRLYDGNGDDALYGGAGNDMLIGGAGDDYLVGGFGIDVLVNEGTDNDIIYLDTREITGNTDILTHFHHTAHRLSGQNKLRVEVSAADLAAINALTTDAERLEALQNRANLRWEKSSGVGLDDTNSGTDDARQQNLHIWHTRLGRSDESDDLLLMVIEDFAYDDLTYAMFDVVAKETNTRVFDVDDGTTPATTPTWILASTGSTLAIESVNGADYDAADSVFEIFSNTIFRLKANTNLDHTTTPHYEVRVKITANNGAISYEDVWVQVNAPTTNADIIGTEGDDIIYGDAFDNLIHGKGGDDYLDGGYSRDVIFGGSGANTLAGGDATDLLFGGFHDDIIYGGAGDDYLYGGAGTDMLYGGGGADTIEGGVGNDITFGGGGDDNLVDLYGTNRIYGGAGKDWIDSRDYNILFGGTGNDVIRAQGDGSWLYGGTGIDVLIGNIFNISTRYYLDTREVSGNTDILPEYDFNSIISIIAHKFLIHTNAENKALIDAETTDAEKLAKLMELENLRFDKGATPDYIDYHTATRFDDIEGFNYADDANTDNTLIYHTRGTSDTYDDILLMVIEDFTQDIIYTMFDVRVAEADFDANGNDEADALKPLQGDIRGVGDYELGFQQLAAIDASAPIIFVDKRTDTTGAKIGTFDVPSGATATLQDGAHPFTLQNGNELWTKDGTELNRETQSTYALELRFSENGATTTQTAYVEVRTENREVVASINTVVFGTENADSNLQGSDEDDSIYGGAGADALRGGAGADTLYGGAGIDTLFGNAGADIFYLNIDDGARDIVRDFASADKILLVVSDALIDMVDANNYKDLAGIRISPGADTIIYDTRGTTSESDDIAIMELQRYRTALTYDSFEIISETAHKSRILSDFGIPGNRVIPDGFRVNPLTEITSVAVDEHEFTDEATAQHLASLDIDTLGADIFVEIESVDGTKTAIPQFTIRANELWLADGTYLSHQDKPTYEVIVRETDLAAETITYHLVRVAVTAVATDLTPTDGADTFYGDAGGERIFGGAGDDILYGGVGADYIDGGYDHDVLHGGAGDDVLFGRGGHDTIYGGAGDDVLAGGEGNDPNRVNISVDYLLGGDGNDLIYANVSDAGQGQFGSIAHGGAGDDRIDVVSGVAYGGTGIDMLSGSRDDGHFYLDTRAMPDNTDIIEHFQFHANEDSGIKNKLVVTITEAQHAVLDKIKNDAEFGWETAWLTKLQEFLEIRWDAPGRAGAATDVTKIIANSDIAYQDSYALGITSGDAFATPTSDDISNNFAIWKIVGADDRLDTNSESDDILILVADKTDLPDGVHPDMFEVYSDETAKIKASGDFTRHVIEVNEHLGGDNGGLRFFYDTGAEAGATVEIVAIDGTNGDGTGAIFEIRNDDIWLREGARILADAERHEIALKITEGSAVSYQIITIFINELSEQYGEWHGTANVIRSDADPATPRFSNDGGTSLAEYYHGGGGNDLINTKGGADWIWGGIGNDRINLHTPPNNASVETIVYRFTSASTGFEANDGFDTITNFRRGEDVLIFSDLDAAPITDIDTFLSAFNFGTSGGKLNIRPTIINGMLEGVEILFGLTRVLKITYTADSRVDIDTSGAYTSAAATYLGPLTGGTPSGYDADTGLLKNNVLLKNYFGAGKLQVIDDIPFHARGLLHAEYAIEGSEYVITGEKLRAVQIAPDPDGISGIINYQWFAIDENGIQTDISGATAATYTFRTGDSVLATYGVKVSYTDMVGTQHNVDATNAPHIFFVAGARNQVITIDETDAITALNNIIAGVRAIVENNGAITYRVEGSDLIEVDRNTGAVSLAVGSALDYESTKQYTATIIAEASVNNEAQRATTKLTINVENVEEGSAVFDIGGYIASGQTLTAALRTDDPDGVDADGYSYQWFTTTDGGTTKTDISGADEASYAIKSGDDLTKTYGVSITYTDDYGTDYTGTDAITLLASKSTAQFAFGRGDQSVSVGEGSTDGLVEVTASDTLNGRGAVTVSPDGKSWTFVLDEPLTDNNLHNESFSLTIMHPDGTTETRDVDLRIQNLGGYVYTLGFGNPQNSIAAYDTPITQPIASVTPRLASVAATGDGTISYSITSGNDDNAFAIDASTGTITLIKALDYETATTRTLEITATDAGNTDASTNKNTATITINVENINDNAPVFVFDGNGVYNKVTIPETIAPGEVVKWIQATDADGDRLTYRLTTQAEHYEIDEDTGRITVKEGHGLDYDSGLIANHRITFSVSDGTTTITETVPVSLTNINDELPMFIGAVSGSDTAILRVGTAPTGGTSTGYKIHVDDLDLGRRFDNYELQFQNSEDRFEFRPDGYFGNYRIFELYLKAGESVAAGDINLEYRIFDGDNYAEETQSITVYAITRTTFTADMGDQTVEVDENDADASVATVKAIGFGTVTYSITSGNSGGAFTIDSASGKITLTEALDYETATSYSLVITATDDGNSDTNTKTNTATITINVQDTNDNDPVFAPLQVDTTSGAIAGLGVAELAGLTGTSAAEYIKGGAARDIITSGGGADHIWGGAGIDTVNLETTSGSVETVYYRFTSSDSVAWEGVDDWVTIEGFHRGEDRIVFLDTDDSVIDLTTFLSAGNRGTNGGQLVISPRFNNDKIVGADIKFGSNALRIGYTLDSQEEVRSGNTYNALAEKYLGAGTSNPASWDGTDLTNNNLLRNYLNVESSDDNLQIVDDAYLARIAADVLIPESLTSGNGKFATVSAADADATTANNQVRYHITGGTGMGVFVIDEFNGEISVSDGQTLDYDTTTSYTLEIGATDNLDANGDRDTTFDDMLEITIGILDIA